MSDRRVRPAETVAIDHDTRGTGARTVFAVRVDPPLDREAPRGARVRCLRVDELGMPFPHWRATLYRATRRDRTRVRTFLVPGNRVGRAASDQLVYLAWAEAGPAEPTPATPRPFVGAPRPVTDPTRYAATRNRPTTTRHDVDGTEC